MWQWPVLVQGGKREESCHTLLLPLSTPISRIHTQTHARCAQRTKEATTSSLIFRGHSPGWVGPIAATAKFEHMLQNSATNRFALLFRDRFQCLLGLGYLGLESHTTCWHFPTLQSQRISGGGWNGLFWLMSPRNHERILADTLHRFHKTGES